MQHHVSIVAQTMATSLVLVQDYKPSYPHQIEARNNQNPIEVQVRKTLLSAYKIQLFKPYFNQETVDKAHENGILCNVFWADEQETAREYLDMGVDTILTNDYWTISRVVEEYK